MRKIFALILSMLMILTLAACGGGDLPEVDILTNEEIDAALAQFDEGVAAAGSSAVESAAESGSGSASETTESSAGAGGQDSRKPEEGSQGASGPLAQNEDVAGLPSESSSRADPNSLRPEENLGGLDGETASVIGSVISPFLVSDDVIRAGIEANGNPPDPRPEEYVCTLSISCKTAINTGVNLLPGFAHLPSGGWILKPTQVSFKAGETVFEVFARTVVEKGIHMEYSGVGGLQYVEGIDNLYEFDGGRWSGWMYCVNGWYPNFGCGQYPVDRGDVIEWNYTCDLGKDLGQDWMAG